MMRSLAKFGALVLALTFSSGQSAQAQGLAQIGYGRLISNDFLGDVRDREQSGSYVSSRIYAHKKLTALPTRAGEVLEFRLQADVKSPDKLQTPRPGDRPYAGSISLGLHTHFAHKGTEFALGAELVAVGPQTRLDQFQTALHDALGISPPSNALKAAQIGNAVYPGLVLEVGHHFRLSERSSIRPFVEARAGAENLVRVGFDVMIGKIAAEALQVREGITGQRYRTLRTSAPEVGFVFGVDTAYVDSSIYLPSNRGMVLTDRRDRLRAGVHWQTKKTHGFFGMTYLGEEYTTQTGPQVVGSIRLGFDF